MNDHGALYGLWNSLLSGQVPELDDGISSSSERVFPGRYRVA